LYTCLIHATNVQGLGAIQVVESIIKAIQNIDSSNKYICYCHQVLLSNLRYNYNIQNFDLRLFRRYLPNGISRLCEILFSFFFFNRPHSLIVMGDIPLRIKTKQVVLVHQPNLLSPIVNPFAAKSLKYNILRKIFSLNIKYATHFVVQTGVMADAMIQSYPTMKGKISVIPQPPPEWFDRTRIKSRGALESGKRLLLFYPSAYYPHKNHNIFKRMQPFKKEIEQAVDKIFLTVTKEEIGFEAPWIKSLGIIPSSQVIKLYRKSDALIYPSLIESYGLPLVEAMVVGMPILCSDLPYARWLCEDQAIYFDPLKPESVIAAIFELKARLQLGWFPDWTIALRKLPKSWDEVAVKFLKLIG